MLHYINSNKSQDICLLDYIATGTIDLMIIKAIDATIILL